MQHVNIYEELFHNIDNISATYNNQLPARKQNYHFNSQRQTIQLPENQTLWKQKFTIHPNKILPLSAVANLINLSDTDERIKIMSMS